MRALAFHSLLPGTIVFGMRCVVCACILAIAAQVWAADTVSDNSSVKSGPPSAWVKPQFFRQASSIPDSTANDYLLLQDEQMNAVSNEVFFHTDRQILTTGGVENDSTITIDFNPAYQSLTLDWVRIWRDGKHLNRLDTNKVQVVQREKDLDQAMLNGEKSAVLVLDDVRVGDIIDCAYSIKGENPVYNSHFFYMIPVQMLQPAGRLFTRVLWPKDRPLYEKEHDCAVRPAAYPGKDAAEFDWDFSQVAGIDPEDSLPIWYDPEKWVQLSDFSSWAEVNQWALKLFQINSPLSPDLLQKINEWKQIDGREQQILAALRFVQDEVRYFGIEIGVGTEKPADPSTVFSQRHGDCKDKSLLFVTILRALGINAYPVLVNAELGHGIDDWQPSGRAFDHCIAEVQLYGETYFVDPTMNYQRGPLAAHFVPNYERGLVVAPGTTGLSVIPQTTGMPKTTVTEYFHIRGVSEPSDLKVVTVAEGRDAEVLRALFAQTKRSDIEENYTHYYSDVYPDTKMSSPIEVEDDQDQNIFQTTEYYSIEGVWTRPDKSHPYECEFYPSIMNSLLKKPVKTDRRQPFGLDYPEHRILRQEVTLPIPLPSYNETDKTISDPSFTFQKRAGCNGSRLVMQYEYQAQADSVAPDDISDYVDHLNQCSKLLGDTVDWR